MLFFLTLLVYTVPHIMVFGAVMDCLDILKMNKSMDSSLNWLFINT